MNNSGHANSTMIQLDNALRAWGTPDFQDVLKHELAQCAAQLPLQQGLSTGNYVTDAPITVMINGVVELEQVIRIGAGIFYQSVLGGCSCADDPGPISENNEYCDVQVMLDKTSAAALVMLVTE